MKIITTFILIISFFSFKTLSAYAISPDYWGIDIWHGIEGGVGAQHDDFDFKWTGIIFKVGKHLPNQRYRAEISGELGHHTTSGLVSKDGRSAIISLWLDRDFRIPTTTVDLYFGLGGGIGHLSAKDNQPGIGDSGIIGVLRGKVGIKIPIKQYYLTVEGRFDHISDVFRESSDTQSPAIGKDNGRNYQGILIGFTKYF